MFLDRVYHYLGSVALEVLYYHTMWECFFMFFWEDITSWWNYFFNILFCTIYEKKHFFKYEIKGLQPIVPSSPDQLLVILLKANNIFSEKYGVVLGIVVVIMGWGQSKSFIYGVSEIYLSCYNSFLQFLYIEKNKKWQRNCCIYATLWRVLFSEVTILI